MINDENQIIFINDGKKGHIFPTLLNSSIYTEVETLSFTEKEKSMLLVTYECDDAYSRAGTLGFYDENAGQESINITDPINVDFHAHTAILHYLSTNNDPKKLSYLADGQYGTVLAVFAEYRNGEKKYWTKDSLENYTFPYLLSSPIKNEPSTTPTQSTTIPPDPDQGDR